MGVLVDDEGDLAAELASLADDELAMELWVVLRYFKTY